MNKDSLSLEKQHLAGLLEAVQRCSYFLNELNDSLPFPLSGEALRSCCKDRGLFDSLAALNERLIAYSRHKALERVDNLLFAVFLLHWFSSGCENLFYHPLTLISRV